MLIAFYAPMKPLDDPVPSGDRQLGRLIVRALEEAGHRVRIASRLRSWSRSGGETQLAMRREGEAETARLLTEWRGGERPDLWITYHLYHKAPDWIGPAVSEALAIPYVVIEASRAGKQKDGPWALGFAAADRALARADAVVALHREDAEGLAALVEAPRLHRLSPFIDATSFRPRGRREVGATGSVGAATDRQLAARDAAPRQEAEPQRRGVRLVTVAMMRHGDKARSYRVLADALEQLQDTDWTLAIAGDGEARDEVLARFPRERTTWLGLVPPEKLHEVYALGDVFVWPAVNEAFGLVLLEAQAAGLPVVAGRSGGVPDVVADGVTGVLADEGDAAAFAIALGALLADPARIARFGTAAAARVAERHTIEAGRDGLQRILDSATRR